MIVRLVERASIALKVCRYLAKDGPRHHPRLFRRPRAAMRANREPSLTPPNTSFQNVSLVSSLIANTKTAHVLVPDDFAGIEGVHDAFCDP